MAYFLLYLGIIWLCAARARAQGRSAWSWGLFAALLPPVAVVATWLVGPKPAAKGRPAAPRPAARARPATSRPPASTARRTVAAPGITVSMKTDDDSIIDVTGPGQVLVRAAPVPPAATPDYDYAPVQLGQLLGEKLTLSGQEIDWLNQFYFFENAFLRIEAGREATARLYVAVLGAMERGFRQAGTTLAQEIQALHQQAQRARQQAYSWYSGESPFAGAGSAPGADIYLALFKLCENAVREHYGHKRKITTNYASAQLAQLEEAYQARLGRVAEALLPALLPTLPAPDEAAELALNAQNPTRWKAAFDTLAARLPADAAGFAAGVHELARLNAQNPAVEHLFFEAAKLLARHDREEALRLYLHYLHHDLRSVNVNNKPLTKTVQKSLFAQPDQLERFTALARQLALDHDLPVALAQVPAVYARPRRKIELDLAAVQAVRQQHTGTVELLNEYLQDAPEPAATPVPDATPAEPELPRPVGTEPTPLPAADVPPAPTAPATAWAASLSLTAAQQALLALFAARDLALPQAEVETLATTHGLLRNQLVDGLNDACYALLDDVLVEESGDDYTIYEPYYQRLTT